MGVILKNEVNYTGGGRGMIMKNKVCYTATGGGTDITDFWFGTETEYQNLASVSDDTLYVIQNYGRVTEKMYQGNVLIYPSPTDTWDFYLENVICNGELFYNTGLQIMSAAGATRDWEVLFNFTNEQTDTTNRGIWGISDGGSTGKPAIELLTTTQNSALGFYQRRIGQLSGTTTLSVLDGQDIIVKKVSNTIQIIVNETVLLSLNYNPESNYNAGITIGGYQGSNSIQYFVGKINKFGFKWLT